MIQKMPILLGGSVPHYAFDATKIAINLVPAIDILLKKVNI